MVHKHTKGPWRVHHVGPDYWTRQVWTDESHGSVMIAESGGSDKDANARLIASAPDLLAALERVARYFEQHGTAETQGIACDTFAAIKGATDG